MDSKEIAELTELASEIQVEFSSLVRLLADPQGGEYSSEFSLDLSDRLIALCAGFRAQSGIDCQLLVIPAHARLQPIVSLIVFRAVRELLTNVQKHAQAKNVEVSSGIRGDGAVEFGVRDDGIGLLNTNAPSQPGEDGFGLWSIVQRLREVGGVLESENNGGACFRIVLPAHALKINQAAKDPSTG